MHSIANDLKNIRDSILDTIYPKCPMLAALFSTIVVHSQAHTFTITKSKSQLYPKVV